ncbi:MAG: endolytic transglycosylase MltG [Actinobacteria bacterium]|nr:endolytic transglycosylase MltG [Actinomycetota bacterium]
MTARRAIEPDEERPSASRAKGWIAVAVSLAVLLAGGALAWVFARDALRSWFVSADFPGPGGPEVVVTIPKGTSITGIGAILVEERVVASTSAFVQAASDVPEAATIAAGRFRLRTEIPASEAVAMLLDPANVERSAFTLREGGWLADHVAAMAEASGLPAGEFEDLLAEVDSLGLPDWSQDSAEGFLFPDTYELPDPVTAEAMIRLATDRFADVTDDLGFTAGAEALDITPLEALVVASIVEREVNRAEDRPKVARVIYNRLAADMPLQMDSTIHYASGRRGSVWTSSDERDDDSPYNTYKRTGLPPGPISSPGRAALQAAVEPAEGDWLFFVAVDLDTGETRFSSTYADHQKAVDELHAWCAASPENRAKCG